MPEKNRSTPGAMIGLGLSVVFLSVLHFQILSRDSNFDHHVRAAHGVVTGAPHWEMFQSRVVGPYQVRVLQKLTRQSYRDCYRFMVGLWVFAFYMSAALAARALFRSERAAMGCAWAYLFATSLLIENSKWLYAWDLIDLSTFTLLTWTILAGGPLKLVAGIILFEALNREVALVMALWLGLDAALDLVRANSEAHHSVGTPIRRLGAAVLLFATSSAGIYGLRKALLVRETAPAFLGAPSHALYHLQFWRNLEHLELGIAEPEKGLIALTVMIAVPLFALLGCRSKDWNVRRAASFYLVLWGATLMLGRIAEARVFLGFTPFWVLVIPAIWTARSSFNSHNSETVDT